MTLRDYFLWLDQSETIVSIMLVAGLLGGLVTTVHFRSVGERVSNAIVGGVVGSFIGAVVGPIAMIFLPFALLAAIAAGVFTPVAYFSGRARERRQAAALREAAVDAYLKQHAPHLLD